MVRMAHAHAFGTYLVMMRRRDKYNGTIFRNVIRSSWSNLSEEYVDDSLPEQQSEVVDEIPQP